MASVKKKYIAKSGIDFEGLKPKVRVESGDPIPEKVDQKTIDDLLAGGDIEEIDLEGTSK